MRGREKGVVERSHDRAAATSVFTFISTHQERPRSVWHVVRRVEANRCDDLKSAGSQVFQTFRKILKFCGDIFYLRMLLSYLFPYLFYERLGVIIKSKYCAFDCEFNDIWVVNTYVDAYADHFKVINRSHN